MVFSRRQRWGLMRCVFVALCLVSSPAVAQLTNDTVPAERTVPKKEQIEGEMNSRFHLGPVRLLPQIQIIGPDVRQQRPRRGRRREQSLGLECHRGRGPGNPDSLRQEGVPARHGAAAVHLVRPPRRSPAVGWDLRGSGSTDSSTACPSRRTTRASSRRRTRTTKSRRRFSATTRMGPSRSRSTSADPGRCTAMRNTSATSTGRSARRRP